MKIKRVNLKSISSIQPKYSGAWGAYIPETDTIYVDSSLPTEAIPSRQTVTQHEVAHSILHKANIILHSATEERLCWLYALATASEAGLTHTEVHAKIAIFLNKRWSRKCDRQSMIKTIAIACGLNPRVIMKAFTSPSEN